MIEVINPVYWKNTPITFSDNEIEGLKIFTKNHINIKKKIIETFEDINDFNEEKIKTCKNNYSFPKLNIVLIAEKIKAPVLQFRKKESYSKILFRMGFNLFS